MEYMPLHPSDKQALSELSDRLVGDDTDFEAFDPVGKVYVRYCLFIWAVKTREEGETKYLATKAVPVSRLKFDLMPISMDPDNGGKVLYSKLELDDLIEECDDISLNSGREMAGYGT